jgi:hypothetical protein
VGPCGGQFVEIEIEGLKAKGMIWGMREGEGRAADENACEMEGGLAL